MTVHATSTAGHVRRLALPLLTSAAVLGGAGLASAHESSTPDSATADALHSRATAGADLAALKRELRPYADVRRALADGFVPVSGCTSSPAGGMGIHYLNPARAAAPVDPAEPSILLYGPDGRGGLELLGVEWFQADADQDLATDDDRPSLWGRSFDGPMEGHEPGMPVHYDLHVWLYTANPAGVFAPWNPNVHC